MRWQIEVNQTDNFKRKENMSRKRAQMRVPRIDRQTLKP